MFTPSSSTKLAAGALLLATAAQAIPLQLSCVQATYKTLADPSIAECLQTEALGGLLPYFFGSSNLSIAQPIDEYLAAYCPAPSCNASTYSTAANTISSACELGDFNSTLSFLVENDPVLKAATCVPVNGTTSNSTVGSSSSMNSTSSANSTAYCLPSLLESFESVTGKNVTVTLLYEVLSGNLTFDGLFPSLNSSSVTNNVSTLAQNETLVSSVCTDCVKTMYTTLDTGFNGTGSNNATSSFFDVLGAGLTAICGEGFIGYNSTANASSIFSSGIGAATSIVASATSVSPIPVSTRSVQEATAVLSSIESVVASALPTSVASAVATGAASAVSSAV